MPQRIIGRQKETEILRNCVDSSKPEFVAVYGRRRVGKTFLVKQLLGSRFCFYMTGVYECPRTELLAYFQEQLLVYSGEKRPRPKTWFEAFSQLRDYLSKQPDDRTLVVFIDELPWFDTPKSNFLRALDLFWNGWASERDNMKLIVCGSATTWMTSKLLGDKGGLHNRVTRKLYLAPFTLGETAEFLHDKGVEWTHHQIAECYMIMGGTPYYLDMIDKSMGLPANIDRLFFEEGAELSKEYDILFRSLFKDATVYRRIVEQLARKSVGMTREQLAAAIRMSEGGKLTEALDNLIACDFLRRYTAFGSLSKGAIYQLTDLYTLFYLNWIKDNAEHNATQWSDTIDSPRHRAWSGYAFEQLCLHHIAAIKQRLGIAGVATSVSSWMQKADKAQGIEGAQIDLVLDRRDQIVNLCEIKYTLTPYELTPSYLAKLIERKESFRRSTSTTKALHLTLITSCGLKRNAQTDMIQSQVTLDDLF